MTQRIKKDFKIRKDVVFMFKNSKENAGIQIADLISYQLRLFCINNESIDNYIFENSSNINLREKLIL